MTEKKRRLSPLLVFAIPFTLVFGAGAGWWLLTESELFRAPCEYVDHRADELDFTLAGDCVRVSGMAHYQAVVKQQAPGTLFREPATTYLYAIYEPYDTASRAIRVLVHTDREPERLVSYELMTVEGRVLMPTPHLVPADTEIILGESTDYFFTDELVVLDAEHFHPFERED